MPFRRVRRRLCSAPKWSTSNIYGIPRGPRAIPFVPPLSIAYAKKPFKKIPVDGAL